ERLADSTGDYLSAQIAAGADAVQLFDTWASLLSARDYEEFALPYQQRVFEAVSSTGAPTILYVNGCAHILHGMAASGATALSVDWREPLSDVRARVGSDVVLQGNLEPSSLFAPPEVVREKCRALLDSMAGDARFIFNLGHGILPETPVASVEALVETVKSYGE
ncbi:MAG: uroporphyrinogen decarboxylase, partial [Planctomycetota bacterium]|nr:uroporphyrinogen decarboxylase [Planctomycetota bacterium]